MTRAAIAQQQMPAKSTIYTIEGADMAGQIDGVSVAIGKLQGQVESLTSATQRAETSRTEMHEKINAIGSAQREMTATLSTMAKSVENLSSTVSGHEAIRQQASGAKTILTSVLSACGAIGAFEGLKHFFK